MAHEPFFAGAVAPEFGATHVKHAPVGPPFGGLVGAVGFGEEGHDLGAVGVHFLEPVLGGLLVVAAVYFPIGDELEVVLELHEKVVRRHLSTGEKIAAHPVGGVAGDKVVAQAMMREDVREEHPARFEPTRDMGEEALVIFEVFKHLDRDDAVELRGRGVEDVDVAGDDREIREAATAGLGLDEFFLSAGVGDGGDV